MAATGGRAIRIAAFATVVLLILAAGVWLVAGMGERNKVTAYFNAAVGLYPDSDVRVLGVVVGTVDAVEPVGEQVKATMSLDPEVSIPANARAVIVTPSLVSDRYVQLTPVYHRGATLADGAEIPRERTLVPVELDELFSSLDKMTTALGPDGANADGALSDLLRSAARNLGGNGQEMGRTIRELAAATRTLDGSGEDLFGTIDSLQKFTTMLAGKDGDLRDFDLRLAEVTKLFADQRHDLTGALRDLSGALTKVADFVRDNRGRIKSNVDKLSGVAKLLVKQRASLEEALDRAPAALSNLLRTYDPRTGTIDARANLNEFSMAPPLPLPPTGGVR